MFSTLLLIGENIFLKTLEITLQISFYSKASVQVLLFYTSTSFSVTIEHGKINAIYL